MSLTETDVQDHIVRDQLRAKGPVQEHAQPSCQLTKQQTVTEIPIVNTRQGQLTAKDKSSVREDPLREAIRSISSHSGHIMPHTPEPSRPYRRSSTQSTQVSFAEHTRSQVPLNMCPDEAHATGYSYIVCEPLLH